MIEYKTGDLLAEEADALVNTVNCVGHMGAGIALQFKKAWPENFRAYAAACRNGEVQPGRMFVYETRQTVSPKLHHQLPHQAPLAWQVAVGRTSTRDSWRSSPRSVVWVCVPSLCHRSVLALADSHGPRSEAALSRRWERFPICTSSFSNLMGRRSMLEAGRSRKSHA